METVPEGEVKHETTASLPRVDLIQPFDNPAAETVPDKGRGPGVSPGASDNFREKSL